MASPLVSFGDLVVPEEWREYLCTQVVAATCTGAGDKRLEGRVFRMVVIDEATQATEPSTLIPLVRKRPHGGASCGRLTTGSEPLYPRENLTVRL